MLDQQTKAGQEAGEATQAGEARQGARRVYDGNLILPKTAGVSPHPANRGDTGYIQGLFAEFPARVLLVGIDTVSEAFNVRLKPGVAEYLETQDAQARAIDWNGPQSFLLGDMTAIMQAPRKGLRYRIQLDGFTMEVRHIPEWAVSIKYSSSGLWQSGADLLRNNAIDLLRKIAVIPQDKDEAEGDYGVLVEAAPKRWQRLSEIHVAVDLRSEYLTGEMVPGFDANFVCHGGVKRFPVNVDTRSETISVGSKSSVQVQIYDKGREIREASGKSWFRELWERSGVAITSFDDIWRVETRLVGDWLKDRGCFTWDDFHENAAMLLSDALNTRRLCEPTGDSNRARWPLHWLWRLVLIAVAGSIMPKPIGLRLQRDTEVAPERQKKTTAGLVRSIAVMLKALNPHDRRNYEDLIRDVARDVVAIALQDRNHGEKLARLVEKHRRIALPK